MTGGTSGIGKATALAFARAGAKVVLSGRREKRVSMLSPKSKRAGGEAAFVRADIAKDAEVKAMVKFAVDKFGRIDIAFNNAGVELGWPVGSSDRSGVSPGLRHQRPMGRSQLDASRNPRGC